MRFPIILLWINSVMFVLFGAAFIIAPEFISALATHSTPSTPSAVTDMRATYGGMALGLGFFFGFCAMRSSASSVGLMASALVLGFIATGRLVGIIVDGSLNWFMLILFATEIFFAVVAIVTLKKIEREKAFDVL